MKSKKTSAEWCVEYGIKLGSDIRDPDGWDRKNFLQSFNVEEISRDEFRNRCTKSTCMPTVWKAIDKTFPPPRQSGTGGLEQDSASCQMARSRNDEIDGAAVDTAAPIQSAVQITPASPMPGGGQQAVAGAKRSDFSGADETKNCGHLIDIEGYMIDPEELARFAVEITPVERGGPVQNVGLVSVQKHAWFEFYVRFKYETNLSKFSVDGRNFRIGDRCPELDTRFMTLRYTFGTAESAMRAHDKFAEICIAPKSEEDVQEQKPQLSELPASRKDTASISLLKKILKRAAEIGVSEDGTYDLRFNLHRAGLTIVDPDYGKNMLAPAIDYRIANFISECIKDLASGVILDGRNHEQGQCSDNAGTIRMMK